MFFYLYETEQTTTFICIDMYISIVIQVVTNLEIWDYTKTADDLMASIGTF